MLYSAAAQPVKDLVAKCDLGKYIDEGGFGSVERVRYKVDGKVYALKTVKFSSNTKLLALMEIHCHRVLKHENIADLVGFNYNAKAKSSHLLMEYCPGGNLHTVLYHHHKMRTRLPLDRAWSYLIQMLRGVDYMHFPDADGSVFVHRDLKPANILFADEERRQLKIADFGLTEHLYPGEVLRGASGTPHFMAPEVLLNSYYNERVDIWSLGCIGFEMLNGAQPFDGHSSAEIKMYLATQRVFEDPDYARDPEMATIVALMLRHDPNERPSAAELLNHPIVKEKIRQEQASTTTDELPAYQHAAPQQRKRKFESAESQSQNSDFSTESDTESRARWLSKRRRIVLENMSESGPLLQEDGTPVVYCISAL